MISLQGVPKSLSDFGQAYSVAREKHEQKQREECCHLCSLRFSVLKGSGLTQDKLAERVGAKRSKIQEIVSLNSSSQPTANDDRLIRSVMLALGLVPPTAVERLDSKRRYIAEEVIFNGERIPINLRETETVSMKEWDELICRLAPLHFFDGKTEGSVVAEAKRLIPDDKYSGVLQSAIDWMNVRMIQPEFMGRLEAECIPSDFAEMSNYMTCVGSVLHAFDKALKNLSKGPKKNQSLKVGDVVYDMSRRIGGVTGGDVDTVFGLVKRYHLDLFLDGVYLPSETHPIQMRSLFCSEKFRGVLGNVLSREPEYYRETPQ